MPWGWVNDDSFLFFWGWTIPLSWKCSCHEAYTDIWSLFLHTCASTRFVVTFTCANTPAHIKPFPLSHHSKSNSVGCFQKPGWKQLSARLVNFSSPPGRAWKGSLLQIRLGKKRSAVIERKHFTRAKEKTERLAYHPHTSHETKASGKDLKDTEKVRKLWCERMVGQRDHVS